MVNNYQICTKCIMDTTDPQISFDEKGVCNHCKWYKQKAGQDLHYDKNGQQQLAELIDKIKKKGKNKKYNCLIGLSGGVDSTMVAYLVKRKLGLRPLAIHLDNGWDSKVAQDNIENTARKLNLDLRTYKADWEEFRDLQLSFLKASVPNAEIPTDHAIVALLYRTAVEEKIKYIISGGNIVTEAIMPTSWGYDSKDLKYIKSIHKRFGKVQLKNYPQLSVFSWVYNSLVRRMRYISILNYIPYVKKDAKEFAKREVRWKDYGGKHHESIYTRFFQCYILARKFNIDKRKAHLSTLICSNQITREEAIQQMKQGPYPDEETMRKEKKYVLSKLGLSDKEFKKIMKRPVRSFKDYPNNSFIFSNRTNFLYKIGRKIATSV